MPGVTDERRPKRARTAPRPRRTELSPELSEVLKMLKALEDQPETIIARPDEAARQSGG